MLRAFGRRRQRCLIAPPSRRREVALLLALLAKVCMSGLIMGLSLVQNRRGVAASLCRLC